MSESLYCLEVLVQTAEMPTDVSAKVVTRDPENRANNFPRAVALRLLDFPLLVIKRDPEQPHVGGNQTTPGDTSPQPGDGAAATAPGDGAPPSLKEVLFDCGKSCLFRSDPAEMEALLKETPMYVMYLDVSNPRKPKLLSTGRMPLSVHYSQAQEPGTWAAAEEEDAEDTEMSPDAEGFARMVVPMYTEMGQPRGRISLCARLSCHGPALLSHVEALNHHHHHHQQQQQQQEHQFLEVGTGSYGYGPGGVARAARYAAAGAPLAGPGPPMPGAIPIQQQEEQRNRDLEALAGGAAAKRGGAAAKRGGVAQQEEEDEEANDRARFEQVVTAQHRKAALRVAVGGGASRRTQPPVLVYYNDPEGSGDQSSCEEEEEVPSEEAQMRRSYGALDPREDSGARGYGHGVQDHGEAGYARGFETSSHQRGYLQSSPPARSEEHGSLSPPWQRGRNGSPRGYSRYSCYPEEHPGDAASAHRRRRNSPGPAGVPRHHHHHQQQQQQQQPGRIDSRAAAGLKSSMKSRRGLPGPRRGRRHHLTHPGSGAGHHHLQHRQQPSLGLPGRGGGHTAARAAARRRPSPAEGSPPPPPDPASSLRRSLPLSAYPTYPRGNRAPYHNEYHRDEDQGGNSYEYYSEDGHYQDDLEEGLRGSQGHPGPASDVFQTPPPSAAATPSRHPSSAPRLAATSAPPATGHGSPVGKGQPRTPGRESMSRFHTEEFLSSPDSPGPRGVVHFSSPPPAWGGTTGVATTDLGSTAGPRGHIHVDTPPPLWAGAATPGSTRLRDPRTPASAGHSTGFHLFGGSRDGLQPGVPFSAGPGASGGRLMVLTPDGTLWPAAAAAAAASSLAPGRLQNQHHQQPQQQQEDTSLRTQAPQSVPQGMPSVEQAQEPEKGPPEGRPSAALTKEQRANAGALADLVREGGVVGALVQELAALLRLRSVGEQSALIRADLEALLGSPLPSSGPLMRGTPARTAWAEAGAASAAETLVALLARSQSQGGPPVAALGAQQQQQRSQATANNLARMEAWQDGSDDHYSADGFESEARGSSVSPTERRKDASRGLQAHPQLQISSSFSIMDAAAPGQVSEGLEGLAAAAFTYKGSSSSGGGSSNGSRSRSRSRSRGSGDGDNKEDDEGSVYSDAFLRASGEGLATGASERQPAAAAAAGIPQSSASDTPRQQQQQHLPALGVGNRQASAKQQALTESSLSTLLDSILEEDRSVASSVRHSGEKARQDPDHTISVESFARSSGSASSPSISDSSSGNTHSGASYSDDTISDDTLSTVSSSHDGASSRDAQPPVNRRDTKPATVTMAPSSSPYNRSNQPPRQVGAPVVSAVRRRV